jgi:phage-related protein
MLIAIGIASFVVAWGLLKGKAWAWIVTIIITIISIILNIISVIAGSIESIVGLIINGIIIYYLYQPSVKSYFGRIKVHLQYNFDLRHFIEVCTRSKSILTASSQAIGLK